MHEYCIQQGTKSLLSIPNNSCASSNFRSKESNEPMLNAYFSLGAFSENAFWEALVPPFLELLTPGALLAPALDTTYTLACSLFWICFACLSYRCTLETERCDIYVRARTQCCVATYFQPNKRNIAIANRCFIWRIAFLYVVLWTLRSSVATQAWKVI